MIKDKQHRARNSMISWGEGKKDPVLWEEYKNLLEDEEDPFYYNIWRAYISYQTPEVEKCIQQKLHEKDIDARLYNLIEYFYSRDFPNKVFKFSYLIYNKKNL